MKYLILTTFLFSLNALAVDLKQLKSGDKLSGTNWPSEEKCEIEIVSRNKSELTLRLKVGETLYQDFAVKNSFSLTNARMSKTLSKEYNGKIRAVIEVEAMLRTSKISGNTSLRLVQTAWYEHHYNTDVFIDCMKLDKI